MIDGATGALLLGSGFVAGVCNAVAGGGTFFTLPVFLASGIPPVVANASNAVAVWPGHAMAVAGYRDELGTIGPGVVISMLIALAGGIAGAGLLAVTGDRLFLALVPWLIGFATGLFAFGGVIGGWLRRHTGSGRDRRLGRASRPLELLFAIYGGYFGAGLGIMMMAGLAMLGISDVQRINALKNLLAAVVTSVAVAVFAVSGLVSWPHTALAFAGAVAGGLAGARLARRMPAGLLRALVIAAGVTLTLYYS